jgi:hypothetical protein
MLILSYHSYTILSCSHSRKEWPVFAHARLSGKYFTWQQYFSQYISRGGIGTHVGCPFIQGGPQFLQNSTMMYCGNELSFGFLLHDNQFQSLCLYFHHKLQSGSKFFPIICTLASSQISVLVLYLILF